MLVRRLAELSLGDVAIAGGKGANLAALLRAGFAVPRGFVITTEAYALAAASAGADGAGSARDALLARPVPDAIAAAVAAEYEALGRGPVAVRSSATAEDLPEASFAGQQDTFLGVEGREALLDAIRRCWASLWNERAVAYRASHGIASRGLALAVVVQRMVDARVAGVLFTADPVTGRRRMAAIDAVAGLGDRLVSGAVNPEHSVVDARDGTVLERGGDLLDDGRLRELAGLGARVEAHFGAPQDIEWALDDERLWLVQSRAITTLYPLPANAPDPDRDLRVYFSANVAQGVFGPLTPMGLQTFRLLGSAFAIAIGRPPADPTAGVGATVESGMRLWLDLTPLLRNAFAREMPARAMSVMEARSEAVLRRLLDDPRLAPRRSSRLRAFLGVVRAVMRTGAPPVVIRALLRPATTRGRLLREIEEIVRTDPGSLASARERIAAFERLFLTWPPRMFPKLVAMVAAGFIAYNAARRALGTRASEDEMRTVLRGLAFNPTTEMDLDLWALALRARADPPSTAALRDRAPADLAADFRREALPSLLQRELRAFLARYGHRAVAEIDIGVPRWSEDPSHLLGALANYQRLEDDTLSPDTQFERGAREAERTVAVLLARLHGPKRLFAREMLRRVRALAGLREAPKFHVIRLFSRGRAMLAPVGAEIAASGRVASPEDVWFLTIPELRRAVAGEDMHDLVSARRAEHRRETARRHVPRVLLSDGTDAEAALAPPAADAAIRGTPASPGIARGIARVIRSPVGARLEPGEVLVAPSTDPGWTPLFLTASALVMEMGGMMSHGAVVAREYGIPAVVGVPGATDRLASGQRVTVDGSAGTVATD